ncbi:AraC family transcriptional regulator [Deminuibacter soli]|nr:helix-turn-helix domain-containing protein [Deminuibacter soli]
MKRKQAAIPRHHIIEGARAGIFIRGIAEIHTLHLHAITEPHRDNHFLLFVMDEGYVDMLIDFKRHQLQAPSISLIWPGQVHSLVEYRNAGGYTISFDAPLMPVPLQRALQQAIAHKPVFSISPGLHQQLMQLCCILHQLNNDNQGIFTVPARHSILQSILTLLANEATVPDPCNRPADTRSVVIEQDFRELLHTRFKEWKKPAEYAGALAISTSHLNDMVHQVSGFSVSHHIQQVVMLEAKRLLYHTPLSVKEISNELGYDDHGYFSRLFKKVTGCTPLGFRQQYR